MHGVEFLGGKFVAVGANDECSVAVFTLPTRNNILGQWSAIYMSPFALQAFLPVNNLLIGIRESDSASETSCSTTLAIVCRSVKSV